MTGSRPVVEVMHSDFLGVAAEPILNQLAKSRYMFGGNVELPMTIRTTEGGGMNIAAQHDGTMHTWFAHLPGILAAAPATPRTAKGLLKASIRSNDPVMVFENKMLYDQEGEVPTDPDFTIPLGVANVVREGTDITVVATQRLVQESIAVADELADDVDVEVIDPQTFYPLDTDTIVESVRKTGRMVVADESPLSYGTHSEIVTRVAETAPEVLEAPVRRVGVMDTHVPFSPPLEDEALPDGNDVRAAVEELV